MGDGETTSEIGFAHILAIPYCPADTEALAGCLSFLTAIMADTDHPPTKGAIVQRLTEVIHDFTHNETGSYLDQRM